MTSVLMLYMDKHIQGRQGPSDRHAISRIALTFASDVSLQIGRRTYTRSELVRMRTFAEVKGREHMRGKHDPRQKNNIG